MTRAQDKNPTSISPSSRWSWSSGMTSGCVGEKSSPVFQLGPVGDSQGHTSDARSMNLVMVTTSKGMKSCL